jgi:uncharacterized protein (TIGR01244 family)
MVPMKHLIAILIAGVLVASATLLAQNVTKENMQGVTNFARAEMTIACAGATSSEAFAGIKKMGYNSIINLRQASEAGADIDAATAAAKAANITYVHLPFNAAAPDPAVVDRFLTAVTNKSNQPAFVHCASGNRAAAMWMIKRMQVDKWDAERAGAEAASLGLTNPALRTFAIDYAKSHAK